MASDLHRAALTFARRGLAVLPLQPRGKEPATSNGIHQATTDKDVITRWWTAAPDLNVGIATGRRSGIIVVDIDEEIGEASLRKLERKHGVLPATVEVISGRGRHLWYRLPEGAAVRNTAGKLGKGIDTRGEGGYIIAVPSVHPSGRKYEWSVDCAPRLAEPPVWLIEAISWVAYDGAKGRPLEEWHSTLTQSIPAGQRNATLASIAGKLLHDGVNLILIRDLLLCVNTAKCEPSLTVVEVETIVASVARTHFRKAEND